MGLAVLVGEVGEVKTHFVPNDADWRTIESAPGNEVVWTMIRDELGQRNEQLLKRQKRLWFFPDGTGYVYYAPTHWAPK